MKRAKLQGYDVDAMIKSGLYILTPDGWLRRGITTGTTASAAVAAAVASRRGGVVEHVEVRTPVGLKVSVRAHAEGGVALVRKFAGDHEGDVTNGIVFRAKLRDDDEGVIFGRGIGTWLDGRKAVSASALRQISENFEAFAAEYGYEGSVEVEAVGGEAAAERTKNEEVGVFGGISVLGTTGFVEPWCERLLRTKIEIAKQYPKIAVTTGRSSWKFALGRLRGYQPFVFGVHIEDVLRAYEGAVVIVGKPGLLRRWAGCRDAAGVLKKARSINDGVEEVIVVGGLDAPRRGRWNMQGADHEACRRDNKASGRNFREQKGARAR